MFGRWHPLVTKLVITPIIYGINFCYILLFFMMLFSTGTGLERVGIVGPGLELLLGRSAGSGCDASLQKQITKGGSAGARSSSLRFLS